MERLITDGFQFTALFKYNFLDIIRMSQRKSSDGGDVLTDFHPGDGLSQLGPGNGRVGLMVVHIAAAAEFQGAVCIKDKMGLNPRPACENDVGGCCADEYALFEKAGFSAYDIFTVIGKPFPIEIVRGVGDIAVSCDIAVVGEKIHPSPGCIDESGEKRVGLINTVIIEYIGNAADDIGAGYHDAVGIIGIAVDPALGNNAVDVNFAFVLAVHDFMTVGTGQFVVDDNIVVACGGKRFAPVDNRVAHGANRAPDIAYLGAGRRLIGNRSRGMGMPSTNGVFQVGDTAVQFGFHICFRIGEAGHVIVRVDGISVNIGHRTGFDLIAQDDLRCMVFGIPLCRRVHAGTAVPVPVAHGDGR